MYEFYSPFVTRKFQISVHLLCPPLCGWNFVSTFLLLRKKSTITGFVLGKSNFVTLAGKR